MSRIVRIDTKIEKRVCQGDIFRDIEYLEYATEKAGDIEISRIIFPLVIVLTQDCDLEQDFKNRDASIEQDNQDKHLLSVIVAPLYNVEHVFLGEHLKELNITMRSIPKLRTEGDFLKKNQLPRYHFLEFEQNVPLVPCVIDFKHYFTVNLELLMKLKSTNFICKVSELYREDISQRFASFLSRIGLPTI